MKHKIRRIRRISCHSANSPNFMPFGEFAEFLRCPVEQSCCQCGKCPKLWSFYGNAWYASITNLSLYPCECCDVGACWGHWKNTWRGMITIIMPKPHLYASFVMIATASSDGTCVLCMVVSLVDKHKLLLVSAFHIQRWKNSDVPLIKTMKKSHNYVWWMQLHVQLSDSF